MKTYMEISGEVKSALKNGLPVVALESTIISHGMPYPKNNETALEVEQIVRDNGAIPATIAIINGKFKIGLTKEEILHLAKNAERVYKTSRRDIPYLISQKIDGATTVASTMIACKMAGIKVFATGGIGGVHKGASETFDISADLQELSNTEVAVVCAGAKSILDIGLTLEYLETYGVPVIGYRTKEMPAFYTQKSGFEVDFRIDTVEEMAQFMKVKWDMKLKGGVLVTNPVPEKYQLDYNTMTDAIAKATNELNQLKISGKASTPFLLAKIKEVTGGKSLEANIELVYNNVKLGALLAKSYCELIK